MSLILDRQFALELIARHDAKSMTVEGRESLLLDWWSIDDSDDGFDTLPDSLKSELASGDAPHDPADERYDPLLVVGCRASYVGVKNEYLADTLSRIGQECEVIGPVEVLVPCPCCEYLTLSRRGQYDICRVCFWEDDGSDDPEHASGPNRSTLAEARHSFALIGASSPKAVIHVLPDGPQRYARASSRW